MLLRGLLSICCFAILCAGAVAQGVELVDVRLTQPPPNQLRIADLWRIELNNRSGRPVRVFLHGTAEELSIPDGIIADARTKVFTIQPGRTVVTGNDVQPVTVDESNKRYEEALLRTGTVPTGDYRICCEVISDETQQILGQDCKFTTVNRVSQPVLIAPPDESEVQENYPVFSWTNAAPPSGSRIKYALRITEVFGKQSAQDAIVRNPAWLDVRDLSRTIFQYPISARKFTVGQNYAWTINAYEERGSVVVPLGQSEVWMFTYRPFKPEEDTREPDVTGKRDPKRPTRDTNGARLKVCPGENWDFEAGSLVCWTPFGDFVPDEGLEFVPEGPHVALGSVGHNARFWFTSYSAFRAENAQGQLLSEEFQIANSTMEFWLGGTASPQTRVEILVQKLAKDTFSLPTRTVPGSGAQLWYIAHQTKAADAGGSDRFSPVRWDIRKYLNRAARVLITDSAYKSHINVDNIRFYDQEKLDTIKQPVLVMAAGENHSLAATPVPKPTPKLYQELLTDYRATKSKSYNLPEDIVIQDQTPKAKQFAASKFKGINVETLEYDPASAGNKINDEDGETDFLMMYDLSEVEKTSNLAVSKLANAEPKNILWGWGDNYHRNVLKSNANVIQEPRKIDAVKDVYALAAGMERSFAVVKGGKVFGWGYNDYGQLGTGDRTTKIEPTALAATGFMQVSAGSRHTLGLNSKGEVFVWGYGRTFELGLIWPVYMNATTGQFDSIVIARAPIKNPFLSGIVSIAAGHSHSLALDAGGRIYGWGSNNNGQAGYDDDAPVVIVPVAIDADRASTRYFKKIAAGFDHSMALGKDGTVWTWGGNASGQLGDGTTKDRFTPRQVPGLKGIRAISAGQGFSLALDSTGKVFAWGNNALGQLGDGTRVGKRTPIEVSRLDGIQGIIAGGAHSLAVRSDGGLWTWGSNQYGQLGQGPVINLAPVPTDPPVGPFLVERLANP